VEMLRPEPIVQPPQHLVIFAHIRSKKRWVGLTKFWVKYGQTQSWIKTAI